MDQPHYEPRRTPAVLNASTVLLGVSFFIVAALRYLRLSDHTLGDETAWFASFFFFGATALSLMASRTRLLDTWHERWADRVFLVGLAILTASSLLIAIDLH